MACIHGRLGALRHGADFLSIIVSVPKPVNGTCIGLLNACWNTAMVTSRSVFSWGQVFLIMSHYPCSTAPSRTFVMYLEFASLLVCFV